ncbi:unnamed protein product [Ambrosiozyma monospora]|uniref:Unnamed protein product n=1 Tax=Ambrosiozyma monospora TaxID=43982 RepID=A0A9W7DMV6_AMBMO|nr:unnamed protein product [Ambrosiozyma monospora]
MISLGQHHFPSEPLVASTSSPSLFKSAYQEQIQIPILSPEAIEHIHVPKLQAVLDNQVSSSSPFNKSNFVQYLANKHCLENIEFFYELSHFIEKCSTQNGCPCSDVNCTEPIQHDWSCLCRDFISINCPKEINLPCDLRTEVELLHSIPEMKSLHKLMKLTKDYLHNSYQDFTHDILDSMSDVSASNSEDDDDEYFSHAGNHQERCTSPLSVTNTNERFAIRNASTYNTYRSSSNNNKSALTQSSSEQPRSKRNYSTSSSVSSGSSSNGGASAWNKLGKKLKWRRFSSSSE